MVGRQAGTGMLTSTTSTLCGCLAESVAWDAVFLTGCLHRCVWHLDFGHKRLGEQPWCSKQHKPMRVNCQLSTLGAPSRFDLRAVRVPSPVQSCSLGDELRSMCDQGQLDKALDIVSSMDQQGTVPSVNMYRSLLKACTKRKSLFHAQRVHAHLTQHGLESAKFLGEDIVNTLIKCGGLEEALQVFYRLPHRNVFCWTSVISGYATAGRGREALKMYQDMLKEDVPPNAYTFVSLLRACGSIADLEEARRIQADVVRYGYETDLFVGTCMVDMYRKCRCIEDAQNVFSGLSKRDVVSWTSMLTAYVEHGQAEKAIKLYEQMQAEGVSPNDRTFVSVLQACRMLAEKEKAVLKGGRSTKVISLEKGQALHADARKKGYHSDVFVGSILISMYGKCGSIEDAQTAFDGILHPDVVSWNAMLAAYVEQGQADQALQLYEQMLHDGVRPDAWTFVSALQSCGMLADKEEGVILDGQCTKVKSLEKGKAIHTDVCARGCSSDVFVGNSLLRMYGKCGKIVDARNVFDGLSTRDVVSWNSMLAAYVELGHGEKALQLYEQMQEKQVSSDAWTFVSALQSCGMLADMEEDVNDSGQSAKLNYLAKGAGIHVDARSKGYDSDVFVGNALLDMYGKCGSFEIAQRIFDGLPMRDVVSWNLMLAMHLEQGQPDVALKLYEQMEAQGVSPDSRSFVSAVQACSMLADQEEPVMVDRQHVKLMALKIGKVINANVCRSGYKLDAYVGCSLISMYRKCGSTADAQDVFDAFPQRNVVSWNLMLAAYVEQRQAEKTLQLYQRMQDEGMSPDNRTFVSALQACGLVAEKEADNTRGNGCTRSKSLKLGEAIHADALSKGYGTDVYVGNTLVSMYGKFRNIISAQTVFDGLAQRDVVTWNALLMAYVEHSQAEKALQLYEQMRSEGISPNSRVFVSTLQACCILTEKEERVLLDKKLTRVTSLGTGKVLHADIHRAGLDSDVFVGNTLVSMYGKCGSTSDAWEVFGRFLVQDVVSWNAMLAAYVEQGEAEKALQLYEEMREKGVSPDNRTLVSTAQACGMLANEEKDTLANGWPTKIRSLIMGAAIHADAWRKGYTSNVFVGNTLVSMYGKCGSIVHAQNVFDGLPERDVVSWNAILAAYVEQHEAEKVLHLYEQMLDESVTPDNRTFVSTIQACSMLADKEEMVMVNGQSTKVQSLGKGKALHFSASNAGYDADVFVGNTLISMYGKCGSMADANMVFDGLLERDVVSSNSMLVAYVEQGQPEKALQLYRQMQQEGVGQDEVTLVCIMQACSNAGSLGILRQLHHTLVSGGHDLSPLLGNTLISAFGRCASKVDAQTIFDELSETDVVSWNALISAYAREGDCTASMQCYEKMQLMGTKPDKVTFLSLLSACSHAGLLDEGAEYFQSMARDHGITPEIEHYVCMADLFGRAGCFQSIKELVSTMPMQPNMEMMMCLLGAYQKHGEVELAEEVFRSAVQLDPQYAASYVLMSNIYTDAGLVDRANELAKLREKQVVWKKPGQSWIEHGLELHTFVSRDRGHPQHSQLYELLRNATSVLKAGHAPRTHCHILRAVRESVENWSLFGRPEKLVHLEKVAGEPLPMVENVAYLCESFNAPTEQLASQLDRDLTITNGNRICVFKDDESV